MTFKEYRFLILSDLYRITDNIGTLSLMKHLVRGESFRFNFWMRTCKYTHGNRLFKYTIHPIARLFFDHYTYKMGISIPFTTDIGSGFYIGHFGGIVVNWRSVIGKNCNISHGVTLGQANRGNRKGYPTLGDNVYLGPGSKIIGAVKIGNNVAVGANCVVTKNIPDNSVVVGIPGKIISQDGSEGYVERTDYLEKIK